MSFGVNDRLLRREIGDTSRYGHVRGIYGDKKWATDLDIVNELDGHTGCVNALR
jgi:DDB1- and CUL4-associated factor 6